LFHWVRRDPVIAALMGKNTGARMPRADMSVLMDMSIPLPPLEEQRRIVAVLDRAAAIRRRADTARAKARALIPALFLDMFGDPATNPKGWPVEPLSELADIGSGLTKGRKLNGASTEPTPYLRVANVQADRLDLSEIKMIDATEDDRQRCRLVVGDLLMTEGGDIDKLGRCAMWRGEVDLCLHQNHVFRVRMGKSAIPDYARAFMQSDTARSYFLRVAKRTTGIASINKSQLGQLPVWVPPLPLQTAFAEQAARIERVARALDTAAAKAAALAAALSAQVFGATPTKGEEHG
jgi:type I restriction enzyme S subunit